MLQSSLIHRSRKSSSSSLRAFPVLYPIVSSICCSSESCQNCHSATSVCPTWVDLEAKGFNRGRQSWAFYTLWKCEFTYLCTWCHHFMGLFCLQVQRFSEALQCVLQWPRVQIWYGHISLHEGVCKALWKSAAVGWWIRWVELHPVKAPPPGYMSLICIFLYLGVLTLLKYPYPRVVPEPEMYDQIRIHASYGKNQSLRQPPHLSVSTHVKVMNVSMAFTNDLWWLCSLCRWHQRKGFWRSKVGGSECVISLLISIE